MVSNDLNFLEALVYLSKKDKILEKVIKESAIDCKLFKNANYYPELGDEDFKCE